MGYRHYKANEEHRYYMVQQVWEALHDLRVYSELSEFEHQQVWDVLPEAPANIMDLGCGMGRAGIRLAWHYQDVGHAPHVVFADSTGDSGISTRNTGAWGADEVYNDLALTASFVVLNDVKDFRTFDTRKDNWANLPVLDLVTSRCAFGMHQPLEPVMERLLAASARDVVMIFGVRDDHYDGRSFAHLFDEVQYRRQEPIPPFPRQDWLILKGKKA